MFEQMKRNDIPVAGELPQRINREDLMSYIEELNQKDDISVNEICELAHAWGHDYVSRLEAYLFLKKANATLDKSITLEDIELYLRFENEYGKKKASVNVMSLFSMLYLDAIQARVPEKEFL